MTTTPAQRPDRTRLDGQYVMLRPLEIGDATDLWQSGADEPDLWRYMGNGPFSNPEEYRDYVTTQKSSEDPLFYAVLDQLSGQAVGSVSLMRMEPKHRVIEVGHVLFTKALKRTRGATEAQYLLARYCFDELGYRRYEWKCNAANAKSRVAALRLGFQFEGIFRQHMIIKGENRDTAWYSMLDSEWPGNKARFEHWLQPSNFNGDGSQRTSL